MGQIQENREKLAAVIGAKLANEFADDQLPAMMHAINSDEQAVRIICQQVARQKDIDHPPALILWKIRERKHTGLIPENRGGVVVGVPARVEPTDDEIKARKKMMREWKRVLYAIRRSQELKDLYDALIESEKPAEVRRQMIEAMDELNAAKGAST